MSVNDDGSGKRRVSLSLDQQVLKIGAKLAAEDNRSFSNYVETLILRDREKSSETDDADVRGKEAA